jgi:hypothetical protein
MFDTRPETDVAVQSESRVVPFGHLLAEKLAPSAVGGTQTGTQTGKPDSMDTDTDRD